jgi:hypothetical protein
MVSGVVLVAAFLAIAGLAGFLGLTAYRRAGAREAVPGRRVPAAADQRLS